MSLPSADVAAYWAAHHGHRIDGEAWGVPLERDGRVLRSAGGGATPGVVLTPDAAPPGTHAMAGVVLHDVADLDDAIDTVRAAVPASRIIHRYEAGRCDFGADPETFATEHLSARRRKRLRADRRRLEEIGPVEARWARLEEVADLHRVFHALSVARAGRTGQWDGAIADDGALLDQWTHLGGGPLHIHVLFVGGRAVSFRTGFVDGLHFVGYKPIVDRSVDKVSLGDLHMRLLIDDLAELGVTTYLMGKGDNEHKDTWATGAYDMYGIVLPSPRSWSDRFVLAVETARQHARRLLTTSGVEAPLRRALHRWHLRTDRAYRDAMSAAPDSAGHPAP